MPESLERKLVPDPLPYKTMRTTPKMLFLLMTAGCVGGVDLSEPLPDFVLEDINHNSDRYGEGVSPRDYTEQVSGWYFIHST